MTHDNRIIFHDEFKEQPYWWEAYNPLGYEGDALPNNSLVVIIGAGYAGLSAALELHRLGVDCCVLEKLNPGQGASTRSGGIVGASGSVKSPLLNAEVDESRFASLVGAAREGFSMVDRLVREEGIDCQWSPNGLFIGAIASQHRDGLSDRVNRLNHLVETEVSLVERSTQGQYIGSDYYYGGLWSQESGHLHPACYYEGLLNACERRGIPICAHTEVLDLEQSNHGWRLMTSQGEIRAENVIVATNGYTGKVTPSFRRRVVPLKAYIIATEIIDDHLAERINPRNCAVTESARITAFYRLIDRPGSKRFVFGSRVKWSDISAKQMAPLLYGLLLERYPELAGIKVTHAWDGNVALTLDEQLHNGKMEGLYYALGCNGSGVSNMTYLGTKVAQKLAFSLDCCSPFDTEFPESMWYRGGKRWFIPIVGRYLQWRDWFDRRESR